MKVALLGPEGTYTHEAANRYFNSYQPIFCSTITEIFDADTDAMIVPIENSLGGGVTDSVDKLREAKLEVTGEQKLRINHCLISKEENVENVDVVKSHPQALSQCRNFIEEHGFSEEETSSTALAVEELEENEAALASKTAAEINGLNILEKGVQDNSSNVTRFLILNGEKEEGDKTSLVLEPGEDRSGLLHSMLGCFAGHNINLSHIQSRPTKQRLGEYYFYVEANADQNEERFKKAVQCLETYTDVDVLGSYEEGEVE